MSFQNGSPNQPQEQDAKRDERLETNLDANLDQALRDFRLSVNAWSEAEYGKPRTLQPVRLTSWRVVTGWALGCVIAIGTLSGGLIQYHHSQELAKIAAAEADRQKKIADAEQARMKDEELLAKVDSDVSRQVPREMEPLAQLMAEDEAQ